MNGGMNGDEYQRMYVDTHQELQQLRDEFDKYKVRIKFISIAKY